MSVIIIIVRKIMTKIMKKYDVESSPTLTEKEEHEYQQMKEKIIQLRINNNQENMTRTQIEQLIQTQEIDKEKIINKLITDINGYGKIDPLLQDDNLEEVMVIGENKNIYVYHRKHGMMETNIKMTESESRQVIEKIANQIQRKIDIQTPLLDARLPDGSRVNATIPPITADGSTITIRKFKKDAYTILDLIKNKTINSHLAAFLWTTIEGLNVTSSNIIIAGGTGSGKTTTLNTISQFIPPNQRIITIEDTLELQIPHKHIIRTETRPPNIEDKGEISMDLLLKNSLRQRPDKIIVGEVRSKEAITLFGALNTGHSGMGTIHANSAHETITRLTNEPMNVPTIMINSIDFIIMQNRIYNPHKGTIRRVTEVAEVVGQEGNTPQLNRIYKYDPLTDTLEYSAISCGVINKIASLKAISIKDVNDEIERRKEYLEENLENESLDIHEVQLILNEYYHNSNN